jgi:YidC/Oxa1 family membrane protein insertase
VVAVTWFQSLLNGIGAVLAWLYDLIPNYGVAIIVLTLAIRVLLLPLAVKQIRSMQAMQAIAPKQKELQRKFKGNRQRIQEETMRLYKEEGVNPLSGCFPILAQFPVLIALFAVLSVPKGLPHVKGNSVQGTKLYQDIRSNAKGVHFLGANLVCSASEAGREHTLPAAKDGAYPKLTKDCGKGGPVRVPYYIFLAAMVATTYYQQKQMQRASPSQNQQQQMLARVMPVFFGFIGFSFPAGLVLYWTTTNAVQIVQQQFMLPKAPAASSGSGSGKSEGDGGKRTGGRKGSSARLDGRQRRSGSGGGSLPRQGQRKPGGAANRDESGESPAKQSGKGNDAGGSTPGQSKRTGSGPGGRNGGDRKKRRKR